MPENSNALDYLDELNTEKELVRDRDLAFTRFFLDTFDWRLFRKGFILVSDSLDGRFKTAWQTCDNAENLRVLGSDRIPVLIEDFPDGKMRSTLAPILEMRALLPQTRLECLQRRWRLLNKKKKTVVRLNIESYTMEDVNREPKKLRSRVRLEAVRGYDKDFIEVQALLQDRLNLCPLAANLLVASLNKVGRHPEDYSPALDLKLEPSMRADSAIRIVFCRLFSILERNESGTKQKIDSEFLHDFRVAIRKTRALLNQSQDILPGDGIKNFAREFAWLGKATGPSRDLDVYLLHFDRFKKMVPVSIRDDLEPLRDFLRNKQHHAQSELVKVLGSGRYAQMKKAWQKFLAKPIEEKPQERLAAERVKLIADARIWHVYKVIHRKGQAIDSDTRPARLHRLRIHCKKLRYLIEFFGSLYPEKQIRHLIKSLKGLQDNLGAIQDLEVQGASLQEYSTEMMESRTAARTLLAIGVLVQELEKERERGRLEFMQRFADFDSAQNRKLFQSLFNVTIQRDSIEQP
ncbi:MAG: CHAD domain-containing protein [Methylococcaceae bacterium]|nr:CHAD domain-containing protein [Methylococcaceae bacterium]MCI0733894.1 CHAD domain-containing protein [Methylococcaceae bacterium]